MYYVTDTNGRALITLGAGRIYDVEYVKGERPMRFAEIKDAKFAAKCKGLADFIITDQRPDNVKPEPKVNLDRCYCDGSGWTETPSENNIPYHWTHSAFNTYINEPCKGCNPSGKQYTRPLYHKRRSLKEE